MKYQIAVLGSHREDLPERIYKIAKDCGREIAKREYILLTGASTGISRYASRGAKSKGGFVVGISPFENKKSSGNISTENYDIIIPSGFGYKGRNVLTIRSADGIIVINGGFGTLNEISIAEEYNKPIVIIEDSEGCTDLLKNLFSKLNPKYKKISYKKNSFDALNTLERVLENGKL